MSIILNNRIVSFMGLVDSMLEKGLLVFRTARFSSSPVWFFFNADLSQLYKTVKQPAWHLSSCATASPTLSLANSFSSWRNIYDGRV
jgi:hypothetical protein